MSEKVRWLYDAIHARGAVRVADIYAWSPWGYNATREAIRDAVHTGAVARNGRVLTPRKSTEPHGEVHESPRSRNTHAMPLTLTTQDSQPVLASDELLARIKGLRERLRG